MANHIDADEILLFISSDEGLYNDQIELESDLKQLIEDDEYDPDEAVDKFRELIKQAAELYSMAITPSSISDIEITKAAEECRDDFETERGI